MREDESGSERVREDGSRRERIRERSEKMRGY